MLPQTICLKKISITSIRFPQEKDGNIKPETDTLSLSHTTIYTERMVPNKITTIHIISTTRSLNIRWLQDSHYLLVIIKETGTCVILIEYHFSNPKSY
jgi:hypothetical protein